MVMELIRDNRKIVDRITHDHIDKFVDLLRRDKNYHYLDLLSVLCVCDGVSIADNQKYITEVWLMRGMVNKIYIICYNIITESLLKYVPLLKRLIKPRVENAKIMSIMVLLFGFQYSS